jgi:ribosome biogenesis protein Nip4
LVAEDFFYAGSYLGITKGKKFFPSFILLRMVAENKANKVVVGSKAAWLFICGRDIFKQGIVKVEGSKQKSAHTLVLNQHGECLGFGRILRDLGEEKGEVVLRNISDIGDFLRREK